MNNPDSPPFILDFDYKKGIFSWENLSPEDLENVSLIVKNLREKIAEIKVYLKILKETQELNIEVFEKLNKIL